jgi:hypothetical protein
MPGGASGATPDAPPTCFLQRHQRHEKLIANFMRAARPILPLAASGIQSVPSHYEGLCYLFVIGIDECNQTVWWTFR